MLAVLIFAAVLVSGLRAAMYTHDSRVSHPLPLSSSVKQLNDSTFEPTTQVPPRGIEGGKGGHRGSIEWAIEGVIEILSRYPYIFYLYIYL